MTAAAPSCHCPVVLTPPSPAPLLPAAPTAPDGKQLLPRQDERRGRLAPNSRPTAWLMIARTSVATRSPRARRDCPHYVLRSRCPDGPAVKPTARRRRG